MSAVVPEAVNAILPVLAAGGVVTAQGVAEAGGARMFDAASRVVGKVRHRLGPDDITRPDLQRALEEGLAAGEITEADLQVVVQLSHTNARSVVGQVQAERVYMDNVINVEGDFHG